MTMTDLNEIFEQAECSADDVKDVVASLTPFLKDKPRNHVIIATLAVALHNMEPALTPEELQRAVLETSQFICSMLASWEEEATAGTSKMMMN